MGYQLKAKTPTQSRPQPARVSADLPVHFIPPYVGSLMMEGDCLRLIKTLKRSLMPGKPLPYRLEIMRLIA